MENENFASDEEWNSDINAVDVYDEIRIDFQDDESYEPSDNETPRKRACVEFVHVKTYETEEAFESWKDEQATWNSYLFTHIYIYYTNNF
jgi:hypothetical protein